MRCTWCTAFLLALYVVYKNMDNFFGLPSVQSCSPKKVVQVVFVVLVVG